MSSSINKSNTRFKPKFNSRPNSRQQLPNEADFAARNINEPLDPLSKIISDNNIPVQSTQLSETKNETDLTATGQVTEVDSKTSQPLSALSTSNIPRRASIRLNSISHGVIDSAVSRRPSFMQSRRPSLINNSQLQIVATPNRVNDILQTKAAVKTASWRSSVTKDSKLLSMKRRRKSSIQNISKQQVRTKTAASVISIKRTRDTGSSKSNRIHTSDFDNQILSNIENSKELMYKVKTLKDVPKLINEEDSKLYSFDDSSFTMAELCKPTLPVGIITANYQVSKEAAKKKRMEREKRKSLRKMARAQNKSLSELTKEEYDHEEATRKKKQEELLAMDIPEPEATGTADLQLKLDKDGKIIVDESSTVIDKHQQYSVLNRTKEITQETNFTNLYNNASYTKQAYTDPWTVDEEIKFYKSLSKWGTDFNFISQLFPYRTRRQIKLKFSLEERKNPVLIELALKRKLPFDFDMYVKECQIANSDPTLPASSETANASATGLSSICTLEQYEEKLKEVRKMHEESLQQIHLGKEIAKSEDHRLVEERERDKEKNNTVGAGGLTQDELGKRRAGEIVIGFVGERKVEED